MLLVIITLGIAVVAGNAEMISIAEELVIFALCGLAWVVNNIASEIKKGRR